MPAVAVQPSVPDSKSAAVSASCGSPMPTLTETDLLAPPYEQVSVPFAIFSPAVNTPFASTVPTPPDTDQVNWLSAEAIFWPR